MADTEIAASLKLNTNDAETKVKSFKSQLREATQQMVAMVEKFGETSVEAANAAKKVAELKDRMNDAKNLADAFNPDRKFQALQNTLSGVAGGFAAIQGAMALVGVQGDDVQKSLLKVQAALALSQGVNNILDLKDTFAQLNVFIQQTTTFQAANNATTATAAVIQKLFTGAVDETSTSFRVLKGVIAGLGIGLLIAGIVELIQHFDEIKAAITGVSKEQEALNKVNDTAVDGYVKEVTHIQILQKELENENTSKARKKELITELNQISPTYFGNIKTETDLQKSLNEQVSKYIQAVELKAKIQAGESLLQEGQKKILEEQLKTQQELNHFEDLGYDNAKSRQKTIDLVNKNSAERIAKLQKDIAPLTSIIADANQKLQDLGGDPNGSGLKDAEERNKKLLEIEKVRLNTIIDTNQRILNDTDQTEQARFEALSKMQSAQLQLVNVNNKEQKLNATLSSEDLKLIDEQSNAERIKIGNDFYKQRKDLAESYYQESKIGEQELSKSQQEIQILSMDNEKKIAQQKVFDETNIEKERIQNLKISSDQRLQLLIQLRQRERLQLLQIDRVYDDKQHALDAERLKSGLDNMLANFKIMQEQVQAQNDLRKEINDKQEDEFTIQLENLDLWYKQKLAIAGNNEALINDVVASYERQRTLITKEENEQRMNIVANILGKAADLFGKQTAAGKALAIAEATINTYTGATQALRAIVPFPEPIATGIRIAQAALIVATGIKSIKEIINTKVPGGDSSSTAASAISTISSATAPIATTPTVTSTSIDQASIDSIGNAANPVRAFVVESDVTDNQEKITRLNRAARLG